MWSLFFETVPSIWTFKSRTNIYFILSMHKILHAPLSLIYCMFLARHVFSSYRETATHHSLLIAVSDMLKKVKTYIYPLSPLQKPPHGTLLTLLNIFKLRLLRLIPL